MGVCRKLSKWKYKNGCWSLDVILFWLVSTSFINIFFFFSMFPLCTWFSLRVHVLECCWIVTWGSMLIRFQIRHIRFFHVEQASLLFDGSPELSGSQSRMESSWLIHYRNRKKMKKLSRKREHAMIKRT